MQAEFIDTFDINHKIFCENPAQNVTIEEFLDFNAYASMAIESDALFDLVISSVWGDSRGKTEYMPFAGSSKKVTSINAREAYRNDHHRNLFGTD